MGLSPSGNQGGRPVRDGNWKLIRFFEDGRGGQYEELDNLKEDIEETTRPLRDRSGRTVKLIARQKESEAHTVGLGVPLDP